MRTNSLAILIGAGVVVGTFLATTPTDSQPAPTKQQAVAAQPSKPAVEYGHLIVQLEGNVHGLNVTWITPKTTGYNKTRVKSTFEIDLLDRAGAKLGTYPIDLTRFDTNPARIGKPLRVQGCEVLDSKIVTMVNVPFFANTASMQIRNGGMVIGRLGADQIAKLTAQGEVR